MPTFVAFQPYLQPSMSSIHQLIIRLLYHSSIYSQRGACIARLIKQIEIPLSKKKYPSNIQKFYDWRPVHNSTASFKLWMKMVRKMLKLFPQPYCFIGNRIEIVEHSKRKWQRNETIHRTLETNVSQWHQLSPKNKRPLIQDGGSTRSN